MKADFRVFTRMSVRSVFAIVAALSPAAGAQAQDKAIASRTEDVDGVRLHYLRLATGRW
jgi:hypothetical protein